MNIYAKAGDKVRFLGKNGMDSERLNARLHGLTKGKVYEVIETHVSGWYTSVVLVGFPGRYNSVMFEDVESETS